MNNNILLNHIIKIKKIKKVSQTSFYLFVKVDSDSYYSRDLECNVYYGTVINSIGGKIKFTENHIIKDFGASTFDDIKKNYPEYLI